MTWWSRRTTDTNSTSRTRTTPVGVTVGRVGGAVACLVVASIFAAGLVVGGSVQLADAQATTVEPVRLSISAQNSVVPANGSLLLWLAVDTGPVEENGVDVLDQYQLRATIFEPLREEDGVDLQPAVPKARYDTISLSELPRNQNGRFRLELPVFPGADAIDDDSTGARRRAPEGAVVLDEAGVYPVTVELSGPDGVVATTRTNLIRLPPQDADGNVEQILGPVAFVLAITTSPATPTIAEPGLLESELTVDKAVDVLTALPDLPIAVLVNIETIDELAADRQQAAALAAGVGDRPIFVSPAVDLDPSALAEVGQSHLFEQAMQQSWAKVRSVGLEPDTTVTVVSRQLTEQGVVALAEAGVTTAIDISQSSTTNDVARSGTHRVNLIRFDDDVSSRLRTGDTASASANRALARLVLRYQTDRSPAVLLGDSHGVDQANSLGVLLRWINRLAEQGLAETAVANDIRPNTFRRLAERPNQNLGAHQQLLDDVDRLLASFATMYDLSSSQGGGEVDDGGGDDRQPSAASGPGGPSSSADSQAQVQAQPKGQTTPNDYRRKLRSALALSQTPQERHRSLLLFSEDLAGEIEVLALPVVQPVTMAASVGEVPVIIESRAAGPRRVMLQFRSDKVLVEQDQQVVVVDPGVSSIDVKVQALTLGSSQLQISVWTPDGQQILASNQFQIRSTAVPGVGVLLSVLAVVLLVVWWYLDYQRRKRRVTAEHPVVELTPVDLQLDVVADQPAQTPDREPVVAAASQSVTVVMPDVELPPVEPPKTTAASDSRRGPSKYR